MDISELFDKFRFTCIFYRLTGLYCPGCGGTRSVRAMIHGKPLLAVHENPAVPVLTLLGILWICEVLLAKSGRNKKIFPRNLKFWAVLFLCFLLWAALRNILPVLQPAT